MTTKKKTVKKQARAVAPVKRAALPEPGELTTGQQIAEEARQLMVLDRKGRLDEPASMASQVKALGMALKGVSEETRRWSAERRAEQGMVRVMMRGGVDSDTLDKALARMVKPLTESRKIEKQRRLALQQRLLTTLSE